MITSILFASLFSSTLVHASPNAASHQATEQEFAEAIRWDATHKRSYLNFNTPARPVEDTAKFGYVLMSSQEPSEEITNLRHIIAKNLPGDVKLVILADTADVENVRQEYLRFISADRLIIATDEDTSNGLWARDSFPVPVLDASSGKPSLVAAHYYRDFTSWDAIAKAVHSPSMQKASFTFVGGNIIADDSGTCFSINSYRLFTTKEQDLHDTYGCKTVHIMPHVHGIGDVDEVIKPLSGKRILTNTIEYKADLEKWGYTVIMLPTRSEQYRTYANSLVVGDRVFMPAYGDTQDQEAASVYSRLGYKVFPITSIDLSDNYNGSVHCQTMAYPPMPVAQLMQQLHLIQK